MLAADAASAEFSGVSCNLGVNEDWTATMIAVDAASSVSRGVSRDSAVDENWVTVVLKTEAAASIINGRVRRDVGIDEYGIRVGIAPDATDLTP